MNSLFRNPFILFWGCIPVVLLFGLINKDENLYINIHDTYFVISHLHVAHLTALISGFIGLLYWLFYKWNKVLSLLLNQIHVLLTVLGPFLIWIFLSFHRDIVPDLNLQEIQFYSDFNQWIRLAALLILVIVVFAQLIFLINLVRALLKPNKWNWI